MFRIIWKTELSTEGILEDVIVLEIIKIIKHDTKNPVTKMINIKSKSCNDKYSSFEKYKIPTPEHKVDHILMTNPVFTLNIK